MRRSGASQTGSNLGKLGFTALAEGLADLGLELCTDPNCGLDPEAYR